MNVDNIVAKGKDLPPDLVERLADDLEELDTLLGTLSISHDWIRALANAVKTRMEHHAGFQSMALFKMVQHFAEWFRARGDSFNFVAFTAQMPDEAAPVIQDAMADFCVREFAELCLTDPRPSAPGWKKSFRARSPPQTQPHSTGRKCSARCSRSGNVRGCGAGKRQIRSPSVGI